MSNNFLLVMYWVFWAFSGILFQQGCHKLMGNYQPEANKKREKVATETTVREYLPKSVMVPNFHD